MGKLAPIIFPLNITPESGETARQRNVGSCVRCSSLSYDILAISTQSQVGALEGLIARMNPPLPKQPTGVTPPVPIASTASTLAKRYGVPESVVEEIISNNPDLTEEEYVLLVQYYKKYGGIMPYNTLTVFVGINQNEQKQIFYLTKGDMVHVRPHPDDLQPLNNEQLLELIQKLLQEQPDKLATKKDIKTIDYVYYDVDVDGKYLTVDIRISSTNKGRIISVFERTN